MRIESCQNCRPDDALITKSKDLAFAGTTKSPTSITGQTKVEPATLEAVDVVDITTPDAQDVPSGDGAVGDAEETNDRGVLRLIAEGHFRGAAAARLRLNFFEQLDHASLPALPEANGNGRGYAKFRGEYEARLAEANPESPDVEPPLDDEVPPTDGVEQPPTDGAKSSPDDATGVAPFSSVSTAGTPLSPTLLTLGGLSILA